jgi:acyl carrier protein
MELAEFIDAVGSETATQTRDRLGVPDDCQAPSGPIEKRLVEIWQAALNVDRIGVHDDFFELGGDSLAGAQIYAAIEEEFGCRLPLSALVEGPTIGHLAARLTGDTPAGAGDVLVPLRAAGGRRPLFCIHELSGTVVVYRRLAAHLSDDQPVYGLQYPGQHLAEPPQLGLEDMAARYCEAIRGVQPAGPYCLAGFSLGGAIAYEIARHLRAAGEEVALLALLDVAVPGHGPKGLARLGRHIGEFARRAPWAWPSYFMRRWGNRRARQRSDKLLYGSATEDGLGARLERLATEILPQAWQAYAPGSYDGRVVLFRCLEDIALWRSAPKMGWTWLPASSRPGTSRPPTSF